MVGAAVDVVGCDGGRHAYTVLDRAHLSPMTFNDRSVEQEVLQLFERQAELLMTRMRNSGPAAIATLAHTLKGSAVGIGAARVAQAAVAVEQAASNAPDECHDAIDQLARAVDEGRAAIAAMQCQRGRVMAAARKSLYRGARHLRRSHSCHPSECQRSPLTTPAVRAAQSKPNLARPLWKPRSATMSRVLRPSAAAPAPAPLATFMST